jgi:hypothetical protein
VSSIAPYSANVRNAILNVSVYPQKIVKIERLQARSSQAFQDVVSPYPREEQEKFYDLARYPELISQLVSDSKTPDQVRSILSSYPKELATIVSDLYPSHESDLRKINNSYQQSQEALQGVIKSLPENVQQDFKTVIGMPDVMNLLTDRIDLTVSLGEAYKNNPEEVKQSLNTRSNEITSQNAKDLDDYKNKVANDPELQAEMKKSAEDFASNYSETDSGSPQVVNNYYSSNPYPYWFGYPYWYPSPIWYPQPLYYHTGFYLGAGGSMVIVGLPSYGYSNWFFNYGYRRYPRMYGRYNEYYSIHRNYNYNINVYHGYNSSVRQHFNNVNNIGRGGREMNRGNFGSSQRGAISNAGGRQNAGSRTQNFNNSIQYRGTNFNNQHINNFHAQQFHQQSWQGVGGGQRSGSFGGGGIRGNVGGGGNRGGGGGRGRH